MQYRLRIASSTFVLLAGAAAAQACGHLPFDELPGEVPDASNGIDSAPLADSSSGGLDVADRDGNVPIDAQRDVNLEDVLVIDGAVPDASCTVTGDCRVIYVSALAGKPGAPGTSDAPVDTIQNGLALVTKLRNELHIAAGNYLGPVKITGEEDVLLYGGFHCAPGDCTWGKDGAETVVSASDLVGGALYVGPNHTRGTIISGLHLKGAQGGIAPDAAGAVTVSVIGSTPVLEHLTIDGPQSKGGSSNTAKRTTAVLVSGKQEDEPRGVLIDDCTIAGGTADLQVSGILVENGPSGTTSAAPVLELTHSFVTGGTAPLTYAVLLSAAGTGTNIHENPKLQAMPATQQGPVSESWAISATGAITISRNVINPSNLTADHCKTSQTCGGILLNDANASVLNNVVHGVTAPVSVALNLEMTAHSPTVIVNSNVFDGAGSGATDGFTAAIMVKNLKASDGTIGFVRNNILLGGRNKSNYGVYELENNDVSGHLAALDHNDIRAVTAAYHAWFTEPAPQARNYQLNELTNLPVANASDAASTNIGDDCLLDLATFHIGQHSPCINAGTKTEAPDIDMDGEPRPNPPASPSGFDIGADESPFPTR